MEPFLIEIEKTENGCIVTCRFKEEPGEKGEPSKYVEPKKYTGSNDLMGRILSEVSEEFKVGKKSVKNLWKS